MSTLAKILSGMYLATSMVMPQVAHNYNNNVTSNEVTGAVKNTVLLTTREAKEDSIPQAGLKSETNNDKKVTDKAKKAVLKHGQVVNVKTNLIIRKGPGTNYGIEYGMYNGTTFDILEKQGSWYKIKHYKTTGYVFEDYVEEYDDVPPHKVYEAPKQSVNKNNAVNNVASNTVNNITSNITENAKDDIKHNVSSNSSSNSNSGASSNIDNNKKPVVSVGRAIKAELTAYCNDSICSGPWGSKTAMGTKTRVGVIAVPKNISLGSKVYIPSLKNYKSDGIFHAEDRGGAIKVKSDGTYVIDVWMPTHAQALAFGRQKTTVYLMN